LFEVGLSEEIRKRFTKAIYLTFALFFLIIGSIHQQAFRFERVSEQTDTELDQRLQIERRTSERYNEGSPVQHGRH